MKLGFDNKREVAAMVGLVVLAIGFIWYFLLSGSPATTAATAPTTKTATKGAAGTAGGNRRIRYVPDLKASLDPSLKFELLKASEGKEYEGGKRNIFREYVEEVRIEKPITPVIQTPPVNPGPPPPPPINLKFYGFASKPGEARKVFLSSGDEVFIAEEGQIIKRQYKIVKITASSVEVEDMLNNNKQVIPLTQG
jgi:hypothetical protein